MTKLHKITSKEKKEKELALSLFRIPINFFAENNEDNKDNEDNKSSDIKTSNSNSDNLKVNPTSSISNPDAKIKINPDESANVTISKEIDIPKTPKKVDIKEESTEKKSKKAKNSDETTTSDTSKELDETQKDDNENKSEDDTEGTIIESQNDVLVSPSPTPIQPADTPKEEVKPEPEPSDKVSHNDNPAPIAEPSAAPQDNNDMPKENTGSNNDIPEKDDTDNNNDIPEKDNTDNNKKPKKDNDTDKTNDKDDTNPEDNPINKNDNQPKGKDNNSPKDKDKDDKAKNLKDKFGKTKPGQKLNDAKDKAKDKLKDSKLGQKANNIKNNPAVSNALDKVNKAKEVKDKVNDAKDAVKNFDTDKMHELAGDTAVKIASKAGDAVVPGAGKVIGAADKLIGNTKTGKSIKKLIGCITCGVGCLIPLLIILIPLLSVAWISNLFGGTAGRNAVTGELTEDEFNDLKEATKAYSMISYEEDTTKKNKHTFWKDLFGTNSESPIQDSLEDYLKNHYSYTAELADKHNNNKKYKNLIKKHFLMEVAEGDLTSFGLSFELLIAHYNLNTLKSPGSSPQRDKSVDDKTVTYSLETNGAHMQLFEDVLNSTDPETMNNGNNLLVSRFNGQVKEKWFIDKNGVDTSSAAFSNWLNSPDKDAAEPDWYNISLSTILNTPVNVYIKEYDEHRDLSLRDLLKETSISNHDTQYYTSLVRAILNDTSYIGNIRLKTLFTELTKKLASLELMTYMLYYQKYQKTMESFLTSIKKYNNSERFSESFFEQFLTFTHIEHFIGLSGAISEPSMAYEIAVASFETVGESIETEVLPNNYIGIKQFSNWFATYHFDNSVYGYNFYMSITDVTPTNTQQYLFDKYNVTRGIYDTYSDLTDEEKADWNKNDFFELFETATGIDTAFDANGNISMRMPGGIRTTPAGDSISYECAPGKFFPIDSNAPAYVSLGFGDYYSDETLRKIGRKENRPEGHHGIDYAIAQGTELFAVSSGTVVFAGYSSDGYGNCVKIKHDDGYISIYAHGNGTFHVTTGDHVEAGQGIMQSGNSGSSSGAHLHFEMYDPYGTRINPNDYLYGTL